MDMVASTFLIFLYLISIPLFIPTFAQPDFVLKRCSNTGNYTSNSTYRANLNSLLASISSNTQINYGFYNFSDGVYPDQVNAIALCRGDVELNYCHSCVNDSTYELLQICPNQKEAMGWYDNCSLRYSNNSIFGTMMIDPMISLVNSLTVWNVSGFDQVQRTLMASLISQAASGDSLRKFAAGNMSAPDNETIYALVQCTPDLDEPDCTKCLRQAAGFFPSCCSGRRGGQVLTPSCTLRYETYSFYNPTADTLIVPAPPPLSTPPVLSPPLPAREKASNSVRTVVIIVVPVVIVTTLVISICIFLRVRKPREKAEASNDISFGESLQFDFNTVRAATDDFSDANKLGQGGFGAVYRGRLPNGQDIAVKRLSINSGQGDAEFKNEVLLLAKLQHRNLVRLLGFCLEGTERLLLYEFMPNKSLDYFIFDPINCAQLDWGKRYKIIGNIARGLLYLHEDSRLRIIHRDLKASNILLDAEMNPKVSDFGMARLFVLDQTQENTSRIVGTRGYMAPEYVMCGHFSVKSDVYSFGVLVLEIVSGQRNSCFRDEDNVEYLPTHAWKNWREGNMSNLIDPTLRSNSTTEMERCIHIGLLCVQENISERPTMASVVLMLSSLSFSLPEPSQPAFFMHSTVKSDTSSSQREFHIVSTNEASITEL